MSENTQINVSTTTEIVNVDVTETLQPVSLECFFAHGSAQDTVVNISETVQNIDLNVTETQAQNVTVDFIYPTGPVGPQGPAGSSLWGTISGTLSAQTDLWRYLSAVGTSNFDIPTLNNYLSTNNILLCSLNVNGQILSAGVNLFDIFLTAETDSQTLSYIASSYLLSISNGNTINLSSINSTFASNSGKYESVYSNVQSNSANWDTGYNIGTAYQNASSSFATNTALNAASSILTPLTLTNTLTGLLVTNTNFNSYQTNIANATATLLPTSIYQNASGNWESTYTTVCSNSANWNQGYNIGTAYQNASGSFAPYSYVNNNFLPLSGGIVSGPVRINNNLTVFGNLTASGTATFANTLFSVTSALSVVHVGSGPAMWVGNNGDGDIASFYDIDQGIEILHVGGNNGTFPNVGVKTSTPNKDFTVKGEISASSTIYDNVGNSTQWNQAFNVATFVQSNSAFWEESADILPTVTNYLSTNNVSLCSLRINQLNSGSTDSVIIHNNNNLEQRQINSQVWQTGLTFATSLYGSINANYIYKQGISGPPRIELASIYDTGPFLSSRVGINTITPNKALTVIGEISANNTIYDNVGNSTQWNQAFNVATNYQTASSSFATNTALNAASSLLLPTSIYQNASGNWQVTYLTAITSVNNFTGKDITLNNYILTTTSQNVSSNRKYAFDTTATTLTATLPPSPNTGDEIEFFDIYGTWGSRPLVIANNTRRIEFLLDELLCNVQFGLIKLIYTNNTIGWRIVPLPKHNVPSVETITILAPIPVISASALSGTTPFTVTLTGVNTLPVSLSPVTNWFWNLTGGNTTQFTTSAVTYTYSTSGTYTVNLTASNSSGVGTTSRLLTAVNPSSIQIPSGYLAFWKLDDLTDSSANGNTLTNNGSVQFVAGKVGNCAQFTGSNSVYLQDNTLVPTFNPNGPSGEFTISCWIYPQSFTNYEAFLGSTSSGFIIHLDNGGTLYCNEAQSGDAQVGGVLQLNQWQHIVFVKSVVSGNRTKIWYNGNKVYDQPTNNINNYQSKTNITLGNYGGLNFPYNGRLDMVGLWNRELTQSEIDLLYNSGNGREP